MTNTPADAVLPALHKKLVVAGHQQLGVEVLAQPLAEERHSGLGSAGPPAH